MTLSIMTLYIANNINVLLSGIILYTIMLTMFIQCHFAHCHCYKYIVAWIINGTVLDFQVSMPTTFYVCNLQQKQNKFWTFCRNCMGGPVYFARDVSYSCKILMKLTTGYNYIHGERY
jgi:hypothetical protein